MEIFIDSANAREIGKWLDMGLIDGVTTNPSIMFKDGVYDTEAGAREIAALVEPKPVSVEVTTNDLDEMVRQAKRLATIAPNIVIKIPQITADGTPCYGVIRHLENDGIKVNATATLSFGQVMLAAKSGATYISIFTGRVSDEGGDAPELISTAADWLARWEYPSKIIVGSIRSVGDILSAARAGAHVLTIPPPFMTKLADHKYTRDTVRQFVDDAEKALGMMGRARVAQAA